MPRLRLALLLAAAPLLLGACGGGDPITDLASPEAKECKTGLKALAQKAMTANEVPQGLSGKDVPDGCKKLDSSTGRELMNQISRELGRPEAFPGGSPAAP